MKKFLPIPDNLSDKQKIIEFPSKVFAGQLAKERWFLILIVTLLVVIWFRNGLMLGSGESGLPFYNPQKLLQLIMHMWSDTPLGDTGTIGYASVPFYIVVSKLLNFNIPAFLIQAAMYWLIFVIGTLSIHALTTMVPENSRPVRLYAALFYIFNPIVHVAVLHRFQYPMIFFYGFIPLALLLYYVGLKKKSLLLLIILSLLSALFSFAFVTLALFELMFFVLGSLSLSYSLISLKRKNLNIFPIIYFIGFGISFFLINFWWFAPLMTSFLTPGSTGLKFFSPSGNLDTFKSISQNLESILSVFRMFPVKFYETDGSVWGWVYYTPLFTILSSFFMIAFIASLFKPSKSFFYSYLVVLSLVTMFLMKGSLPPFGEVSLTLMYLFTPLQVFRNPFEKIGLLLPLVMAIPVGFGVNLIVEYIKTRLRFSNITIIFLIILVFPIYMFPIVNGFVFTGGGKPSDDLKIGQYVKVPNYYTRARDFLNKQSGLYRVLALPIDGEGMTYNWEYGYAGVELSNTLFDQSFISFSTGQSFLPEITNNIIVILDRYPEKFWFLSQILNIRYIVQRNDIDYQLRGTKTPWEIMNIMNNKLNGQFSFVSSFYDTTPSLGSGTIQKFNQVGNGLNFFEFNPQSFNQRIYTSASPIYTDSQGGGFFGLIPFSDPTDKGVLISPSDTEKNAKLADSAQKFVIGGLPIDNLKLDDSLFELPFVHTSRNSLVYRLIKIKEDLEMVFLSPIDRALYKTNLLAKRLSEMRTFPQDRQQALIEYRQLFSQVADILLHSNFEYRDTAINLLHQRQMLEDLKREDPSLNNQLTGAINEINDFLKKAGYASIFPSEQNVIFRFSIPSSGEYEIILPQENWDKFYKKLQSEEITINGQKTKVDIASSGDKNQAFSFGTHYFDKGVSEISLSDPQSFQLIDQPETEEFTLNSKDRKVYKKYYPIKNLDIYSTYQISFEYQVEKGNGSDVALEQNSDPIDKDGNKVPRLETVLSRGDYDYGWKKYTKRFSLDPVTKQAGISFKIIPWGDCKNFVKWSYRRYCKDEEFNKKFLRDSVVNIRNLKVERVFLNQLILKSTFNNKSTTTPPKIVFNQIDPTHYNVHIEQAQSPFFLVLSTTFNTQWKVYLANSSNTASGILNSLQSIPFIPDSNHFLANGYSNGWYIDKLGNYDLSLEFYPEKIYIIGRKISIIFIVIGLSIVLGIVIYKLSRFLNIRK